MCTLKYIAILSGILPLTLGQIGDFWRIQFESFWATFGWMLVRAPDWFYIAARVLLLLSLAGIALAWIKGRLRELNTLQRRFMVYLGISILVLEGILIVNLTQCMESCYQGRYLLPVIGPIMLLIGFGIWNLIPRWSLALSITVVTGMLIANIFLLNQVILPTYKIKALPLSKVNTIPNLFHVGFNDKVDLIGYEYNADKANNRLRLNLFWQAKQLEHNFTTRVNIIDPNGSLLTSSEAIPGKEIGYPPRHWLTGDLVEQHLRIDLPDSAPEKPFHLQIQVVDGITGNPVPVLADNGSTSEWFDISINP